MDAGYVTLQEADAFLDLQIGTDAWFDTETLVPLAGTVVSSLPAAPSDIIAGTSTAFDADFAPADYFEADYQIAKVLVVTNAASLQLDAQLSVLTPAKHYRLTQAQAERRKALYRKKLQALHTAFRRITLAVDLTDYDTTPQSVKDAQCVFALHLFTRPRNAHAENIANGIKRAKVGDMEYEYSGQNLPMPEEVLSLLDQYLTANKPVQLYRAPINPGPILDELVVDEFGFPYIP